MSSAPAGRRPGNLRTALLLASIALAFFAGTVFDHLLAR